jgi:hypothetical protein
VCCVTEKYEIEHLILRISTVPDQLFQNVESSRSLKKMINNLERNLVNLQSSQPADRLGPRAEYLAPL